MTEMDVDISAYTYKDAERVRFGRYPVLDTVLYRWAKRLELSLFDYLNTEVYTGASVFEEMPFSSFFETMKRPRPMYFFEMAPYPDRGLFMADNRFSAFCLARLGSKTKEGRPQGKLSTENQKSLQGVVQILLKDFEASMADLAQISLKLKRVTTSPFRARFLNAYESCLVGQVHISARELSSRLTWCFPRRMLDEVLEVAQGKKIVPPDLVNRDTGPKISEISLLKLLKYRVPLKVGEVGSLSTLDDLKVGQVLPLKSDAEGMVVLDLDGEHKLVGSLGEVMGKYALKVEGQLKRESKDRNMQGEFKPLGLVSDSE